MIAGILQLLAAASPAAAASARHSRISNPTEKVCCILKLPACVPAALLRCAGNSGVMCCRCYCSVAVSRCLKALLSVLLLLLLLLQLLLLRTWVEDLLVHSGGL
jgi:hypothetical protein